MILPRDLGVEAVRRVGVEALVAFLTEGDRGQPAVALHDLSQGEVVLAPPFDVGGVAEGADHQDASALLGVGLLAREDRNGHAEERGDRALPEEGLEARIVGVRRDADAGGQELGARRRDHERTATLHGELEVVVRAGSLAVFDLGLGDGALEIDVPHGGRVSALGVALGMKVEERALGHAPGMVVDRLVLVAPVDREAEPLPERLEGLLVLAGDVLARLDEVGTRQLARRLLANLGAGLFELEIGFVGRRGVAAHVIVVLDATLGGQAVVVPAHRVEDVPPPHALVARQQVGVGVGEDVSGVERARRRRRWRIDHERLVTRALRVVVVEPTLLPAGVPSLFGLGRVEVLGQAARIDGGVSRAVAHAGRTWSARGKGPRTYGTAGADAAPAGSPGGARPGLPIGCLRRGSRPPARPRFARDGLPPRGEWLAEPAWRR